VKDIKLRSARDMLWFELMWFVSLSLGSFVRRRNRRWKGLRFRLSEIITGRLWKLWYVFLKTMRLCLQAVILFWEITFY
jgi:hypothetical protein